jgi:hypothetical protein
LIIFKIEHIKLIETEFNVIIFNYRAFMFIYFVGLFKAVFLILFEAVSIDYTCLEFFEQEFVVVDWSCFNINL